LLIKSIILVTDAYPPSRISAALQLRDLALEFLKQGITATVVTTEPGMLVPSSLEELDGIRVLRLRTPKHRGVSYMRRALAEIMIPFFLIKNFRKSVLKNHQWDAVIWYSPTIFLGPFIFYLKKKCFCPSYLILRDIFPAWALDLGLIKKGFAYYVFRIFEKFQYFIADCIGVQAAGNLNYFKSLSGPNYKKIEVLHNWINPKPVMPCSISVESLRIKNRKIFIYAGNMGIAQGMDDLLLLAESLLNQNDIGFLFVGRGSDKERLKNEAKKRNLVNTVFIDEIEPSEIPGLYAQCNVGLIALDPRHKTHNIPGKFLTYLQSGLPVFAIINEGNDLQLMIEKHQVGKVTSDRSQKNLQTLGESLMEEVSLNPNEMSARCKKLATDFFSSKMAVETIINSLSSAK